MEVVSFVRSVVKARAFISLFSMTWTNLSVFLCVCVFDGIKHCKKYYFLHLNNALHALYQKYIFMHCISFVPLVLIIFNYVNYSLVNCFALLTPIAWGRMTNRDWIVFVERREINVSAAQSGSFTISVQEIYAMGIDIQQYVWWLNICFNVNLLCRLYEQVIFADVFI